MTHYDVDYSNLHPQAKHEKAIADIKDYLGEAKFVAITNDFRKYPPQSIDALAMYLSIAGVQGYPVRAWHDVIWPYG